MIKMLKSVRIKKKKINNNNNNNSIRTLGYYYLWVKILAFLKIVDLAGINFSYFALFVLLIRKYAINFNISGYKLVGTIFS